MMQNLYLHLHELRTKVCFCGHSAGKHTFHKTWSVVIYVIHCNYHLKKRIITWIKDALIRRWVDAVFSSFNQQCVTVANLTVQLFSNLERTNSSVKYTAKQCDQIPCIFPIISYGYNIMSLPLKKENNLQLFEIKKSKKQSRYRPVVAQRVPGS